jgi:rifampicin phosphotransferase
MPSSPLPASVQPDASVDALVLDLAEIDLHALPVVGGKAANLGALTRAGLPVPPGVCLTTEAYRQVAASAGIDELLEALAAAPPADVARLAALASAVRKAILATPVPRPIAQAVAAGYERLGRDVPVAVRSSATAEDLPFASFAGQQDTYLHVIGREAVLDAVRRCWASLWTDRAVAYRATNGIDHRAVRLAVVIQRMVDAATAGVLFTANPVTGRRREAVIDASPGLGEAVVSGATNPDHFVVDTASGEILERRIGDKRVLVRARPGGGTERIERAGRASGACLADDQVRSLVQLGDRVERHYGVPQDTEWAFDETGALWLTQARPITTLFPLPEKAPPAEAGLRVYFCFNVAQGVYRPMTPMGLAGFRLLASSLSSLLGFPVARTLEGPAPYAEAGQRIFVDVTAVLRSAAGRALMRRVLDVMEARASAVLQRLYDDPRLAVTSGSWWSVARRVLRVAVRSGAPATALRALASPAAAQRHAGRIGRELAERLRPFLPASALQRLSFVERVLLDEAVPLVPRILPAAGVGFALLALAGKLLGAEVEPDELQTVLRGLPDNVTTEMDLALWALGRRIASDGDSSAAFGDASPSELAERFRAGRLPVVAQLGLAEFLDRYGHRAVAEIDLGMPRWSDDPRHILGVIQSYLRLGDAAAPDAQFARGAAEAEAMIETLASRARRRGLVRAWLVRFGLRRARALGGLRELPKYHLVMTLAAARRELGKVGAELAAQGRLERAEDVFFLDLAEARAAVAGRDLRDTVARRREAYDLELRRPRLPRVLLSDGTEPEARTATMPGSVGAIVGTPASAGRVAGAARVILDPSGAQLLPGEILVAPSTDPGWTPLFLVAGGLVMEMGGANSHGAVVAREYGIPAIVGVPDATARIRTGQRVEVDGSAGTVRVV